MFWMMLTHFPQRQNGTSIRWLSDVRLTNVGVLARILRLLGSLFASFFQAYLQHISRPGTRISTHLAVSHTRFTFSRQPRILKSDYSQAASA